MELQIKFLAFAAACFLLDACTTAYAVSSGIAREANHLSLWTHGGMGDAAAFILAEEAFFAFVVLMSHFVENLHAAVRLLERWIGKAKRDSPEEITSARKILYLILFLSVGVRLACGVNNSINIVSFWLAVG